MKTWQKWVVGISIILGCVGSYLAATFDGDASTNVSITETVDGIRRGIDTITADSNDTTTSTSDTAQGAGQQETTSNAIAEKASK